VKARLTSISDSFQLEAFLADVSMPQCNDIAHSVLDKFDPEDQRRRRVSSKVESDEGGKEGKGQAHLAFSALVS